jgi:hypothetical protein
MLFVLSSLRQVKRVIPLFFVSPLCFRTTSLLFYTRIFFEYESLSLLKKLLKTREIRVSTCLVRSTKATDCEDADVGRVSSPIVQLFFNLPM